jgi:hypothetical protein
VLPQQQQQLLVVLAPCRQAWQHPLLLLLLLLPSWSCSRSAVLLVTPFSALAGCFSCRQLVLLVLLLVGVLLQRGPPCPCTAASGPACWTRAAAVAHPAAVAVTSCCRHAAARQQLLPWDTAPGAVACCLRLV